MNKKITLLTLLGLVVTGSSFTHSAMAVQTWNTSCSNITADSSIINANSLSATNYIVQAPDNKAVKMTVQQLTATKSSNVLSDDQFRQITNVTSTGILNLILSHKVSGCSKDYYTNRLTPLLDSLKNGEKVNMTWNNLHIQNSKTAYAIRQLNAQLSGEGNNVHVIVSFSGLSTSSQHQLPSTFIPTQGNVNVTTTAQVYPLILAAANGNTNAASANSILPVTINNLDIRNAQTAITANGNVTLNHKPRLTGANGTVRIANIESLIAASNQTNSTKLKTGLILAKFAGRSVGNNILEWDIQWQGNLLKVNSVPIPVW